MIDKVKINKLLEERFDTAKAIDDVERTIKTYREVIEEKLRTKRRGYSSGVKHLRWSIKSYKDDIRRLKENLKSIDREIAEEKRK